ncbi:hypothetical protein ABKA04_004897 [Annulohypoxylon sp. FPYF3050]
MTNYSALASLMGKYSDVAIFRRFRNMNLHNLLRMQAELVHIEQELREIAMEDDESSDPVRQSYGSNWIAMEEGARSGSDSLQRTKLLEAREKLEKYNASLLTQARLNALPSPEEQSLGVLQGWLERPAYGNGFLQGVEKQPWNAERADMVTLQKEREDTDLFTGWLFRVIPGFFHNQFIYRWKRPAQSREGEEDLFEYKDSTLSKIATLVTTFFSIVFPVLSIFILYYVENMPIRLGLILSFTSLFALVLLLVSRVRRVEIFMATLAFAAVQVVFVGNTPAATA